MDLRTILFVGLGFWLLPHGLRAQSSDSSVPLRFKFTPGQTLRYVVMRDPYFADPAAAIETTNPIAPYRSPIVERLTEEIQAVRADGTATIKVTVGPEPGFEDAANLLPTTTQIVTVSALGQVLSEIAASPNRELLRAFFRLPTGAVKSGAAWKGIAFQGTEQVETTLALTTLRGGNRGLAIITQTLPASVSKHTSPDHDGTLLQTTNSAQSDRIVFDAGAGNLLRQTSTVAIRLSLLMTNRGSRGSADFGHVVPNVEVTQTLTIERKDDLPVAATRPPRAPASPSSTGRRSGN